MARWSQRRSDSEGAAPRAAGSFRRAALWAIGSVHCAPLRASSSVRLVPPRATDDRFIELSPATRYREGRARREGLTEEGGGLRGTAAELPVAPGDQEHLNGGQRAWGASRRRHRNRSGG